MPFYSKVVGVTHRNRDGMERQTVARQCRPGELLRLIREPQNKYDSNAVAVYRRDGHQVGYLSSEISGEVAERLDAGERLVAQVQEVTGGTRNKPSCGVNIEICEGEASEIQRAGCLGVVVFVVGSVSLILWRF